MKPQLSGYAVAITGILPVDQTDIDSTIKGATIIKDARDNGKIGILAKRLQGVKIDYDFGGAASQAPEKARRARKSRKPRKPYGPRKPRESRVPVAAKQPLPLTPLEERIAKATPGIGKAAGGKKLRKPTAAPAPSEVDEESGDQ